MTKNIEILGAVVADLQRSPFALTGLPRLALEGLKAVHYELCELREEVEQLKRGVS